MGSIAETEQESSVAGKVCSKCGKWKPLDEYYKDKSRATGRRASCKACASGGGERARNRDKHRQSSRASYARNPEKERERSAAYRATNIEKVRAKDFAYRARNRDKHRQSSRGSYARNPEKERERSAAYRATNIEKVRAKDFAYRARNRVNRRQEKYRRRGLIKSAGHFTQAEWDALCAEYGNRCLACGSTDDLTVDHVVPISRGGKNTIDNIQVLCRSCNSRKGTQSTDYRT